MTRKGLIPHKTKQPNNNIDELLKFWSLRTTVQQRLSIPIRGHGKSPAEGQR